MYSYHIKEITVFSYSVSDIPCSLCPAFCYVRKLLCKRNNVLSVLQEAPFVVLSLIGKVNDSTSLIARPCEYKTLHIIHCVQKKNTHSHFLTYLYELFVDVNKNCSEYTQGVIDSNNVKIRYSLRSMM